MAARASAAPSEDAATSSSHWVVRKLGRPPAVESSSASSKPDFVRKYLWHSRKSARLVARASVLSPPTRSRSLRSLAPWPNAAFCADNLVKNSFSHFLETSCEIFGRNRRGDYIFCRAGHLFSESGRRAAGEPRRLNPFARFYPTAGQFSNNQS